MLMRCASLFCYLGLLFIGLSTAVQSQSVSYCDDASEDRRAYFGDLHVHTRLSLDAATQDTRTSPSDAYRFARGEAIGLQPYSRDGKPDKMIQIRRPIDFAAITDHAELLGEVEICSTPGMKGYLSPVCMLYRYWPRAAFFYMNYSASEARRHGFCGQNSGNCLEAALRPWQEIKEAAADAYEPCHFTSFVGYEWTGSKNMGNIHRNVIFRNHIVPEYPVSFTDTVEPVELWKWLQAHCLAAGNNCDALVIPHNSNLSAGYMFPKLSEMYENDPRVQSDILELNRQLEPIVEILQHKGSSECFYGSAGFIGRDELCAFEQLPYDTFSGKFDSSQFRPPQPDSGFLREVLREGLRQQSKLGINAYQLGYIGSTDTHISASGRVEEDDYDGQGGAYKSRGAALKDGSLPDDIEGNPGGLAVIWAEQNTREALFDALRRRETYATSGPRIQLRFFGGWDYSDDMCNRSDFASVGYTEGIPMGGELPPATDQEQLPRFAVAAWMDAGTADHPGVPLQRLQIIKGWVDNDGASHEEVYDVAGTPNSGRVNVDTCEVSGEGHSQLCTVWQDPDFDPRKNAYYYARAVQNPSCRWQQYFCNKQGVDCNRPENIPEALQDCCASSTRKTIQERALSSPIWFKPPPSEQSEDKHDHDHDH